MDISEKQKDHWIKRIDDLYTYGLTLDNEYIIKNIVSRIQGIGMSVSIGREFGENIEGNREFVLKYSGLRSNSLKELKQNNSKGETNYDTKSIQKVK